VFTSDFFSWILRGEVVSSKFLLRFLIDLTRISSLVRRSLHVIHNHLEFAFAVIRRRIKGSFILQTQQLLVLWQLYLVLSVQEHGLKENGFDREGQFSLLIEKVDLLVDGHRNLLIDVSSDPRMLQCTLCIVSD